MEETGDWTALWYWCGVSVVGSNRGYIVVSSSLHYFVKKGRKLNSKSW